MNDYKLSDEVISHICRQLQVAMLTGTDVVDNLRVIRVASSDVDESELVLSSEYREISDQQIESMLKDAESLSE
tara:strand:- start:2569 stop:2790 length:222 start_codon:yes stop_codon:yes gene_type:complete